MIKTHASLFSGIGGFDLAAEWMGWQNVFQVENDPWCQKILRKNFPNTEIYGDITEFKPKRYPFPIDIVSGGFPCQPFSLAGRRQGEEDDRHLWPEMLRVIREINQQQENKAIVVGENVAGITTMENGKVLEGICIDLETAGYSVWPIIIPDASVEAWHRRERIWIIAYPDSESIQRYTRDESKERQEDTPGRNRPGDWSYNWQEVIPSLCGKNDGVPKRMDRIKGLGNAIVPQIAFEIFKAIDKLV